MFQRVTLRVTLVVAALAFTVSGCGSDAATDAATDRAAEDAAAAEQPAGEQSAAPGDQQGGGPFGGVPGTSGQVADLSGTTMQVQGEAGQAAVSWTDETTFTQQVEAALSDVAVGSCVTVSRESSASASEGATDGPVVASSVRVSEPVDGSCEAGFGGGPGAMPSGMPTAMPSDRPSDLPSGAPGGFGSRVVGEVVEVSAAGFTVESTGPTMGQESASAEPETTSVEVQVGDDTEFTATESASADALKVGRCVTARGETADTGAVTAESVSITDPVDGECSTFPMGGRPQEEDQS